MNSLIVLYAAVLFFIMTPQILFRLPFKGGKITTAAVHSILFAVVFYLTSGLIMKTQESLCTYSVQAKRNGAAKTGNDPNGKIIGANATEKQKLDNSSAAPAWKGKWTCKNDNKCGGKKPCWVNDDNKNDIKQEIINTTLNPGEMIPKNP